MCLFQHQNWPFGSHPILMNRNDACLNPKDGHILLPGSKRTAVSLIDLLVFQLNEKEFTKLSASNTVKKQFIHYYPTKQNIVINKEEYFFKD